MENDKLILIKNFCLHHKVEMSFVFSLQKFGLIAIQELEENYYFTIDEMRKLEKMGRLHHDLGVNLAGINAVISLLQQIEQLKLELVTVKNSLAKLGSFDKYHKKC